MTSEVRKLGVLGVVGNLALAGVKLFVGSLASSAALVADGVHSASDTLGSAIAWIGIRYAEVPPDEDHPYGHGNAEALAALAVGVLMTASGLFMVVRSLDLLGSSETLEAPGALALWTALACAGVKEAMARITLAGARRTGSPALEAEGRDHRGDALTALAPAAAVGLARQGGWAFLDPAVGALIGVYVAILAIPVLRMSVGILMDAAPPGDPVGRIRSLFETDEEVRAIHTIRVHQLGATWRADLEIDVDGGLSVTDGHAIAHRVRDTIVGALDFCEDVQVHVNPYGEAGE